MDGPEELDVVPRLRISVAHHNPRVLALLSRSVSRSSQHELAGETCSGLEAMADIRRVAPDVSVLDLDLDGFDGVEIVAAIDRDRLQTRVVLLWSPRKQRTLAEALIAGARCILSPQAGEEELLSAVTIAGARGFVISRGLHPALVRDIRRRSRVQGLGLDDLSEQIFSLTADGLSPLEIATRLELRPASVAGRLDALCERLEVNSHAGAVAKLLRRGVMD